MVKLWDRYYNNLLNEQVTKKRISKLQCMFNVVSEYIDIEKSGRPQIESFLERLNRDEIKRHDGGTYSGSTKSDIKKFLKQFYKWLRGNNELYPSEVSWIKTRIAKDEKPEEKPVLSLEEVIKLSNGMGSLKYQIMTLLLFDSGFRIQELFSVRKRDLTFEEFEDGNKCFWINCNQSKTILRKVPVPIFTENIQSFLNSTEIRTLSDDAPLFNGSYQVYLRMLKTKSLKMFNKKVCPHALRHSSATHYTKEYDGNMNLLCERYGWAYGSKELQLYIRRSGIYQKAGARKVYENETIKLKRETDDLKRDMATMRSEMEEVLKAFNTLLEATGKDADLVNGKIILKGI